MRASVPLVLIALLVTGASVAASGHGPLFGMSTPTNGAGAWAVDFGAMGRVATPDSAAAIRTMLSYGIHEDLQISASVPFVLGSAPLPAARMTGMMPGGGDFESIVAWRFRRQGTNVGRRVESTAYGGLIVPAAKAGRTRRHLRSRAGRLRGRRDGPRLAEPLRVGRGGLHPVRPEERGPAPDRVFVQRGMGIPAGRDEARVPSMGLAAVCRAER